MSEAEPLLPEKPHTAISDRFWESLQAAQLRLFEKSVDQPQDEFSL